MTYNPDYDTPEILKDYAERHHIDVFDPNFKLLNMSLEDEKQLFDEFNISLRHC